MKTKIILLALVIFLLASLFVNGCIRKQTQTTIEQDQQDIDKMLSDISDTSLDDIDLGITDDTSDVDEISDLI